MSARAVSSATIAFGLVSIPIKLYAATQSKALRFHLLHAADRSRLQQHYSCRGCGERVERDQTVKGYEVARDRHVVLTEEELEALQRRRERDHGHDRLPVPHDHQLVLGEGNPIQKRAELLL